MDFDSIRKRTVEEDTLLGTRTAAFLVGNGFVLTALGANAEHSYKLVIAVFGLAVSLIWLLTVVQSFRAIQALHNARNKVEGVDKINMEVTSALFWESDSLRKYLGPSALVSIWLPCTVISLWLVITWLLQSGS